MGKGLSADLQATWGVQARPHQSLPCSLSTILHLEFLFVIYV